MCASFTPLNNFFIFHDILFVMGRDLGDIALEEIRRRLKLPSAIIVSNVHVIYVIIVKIYRNVNWEQVKELVGEKVPVTSPKRSPTPFCNIYAWIPFELYRNCSQAAGTGIFLAIRGLSLLFPLPPSLLLLSILLRMSLLLVVSFSGSSLVVSLRKASTPLMEKGDSFESWWGALFLWEIDERKSI